MGGTSNSSFFQVLFSMLSFNRSSHPPLAMAQISYWLKVMGCWSVMAMAVSLARAKLSACLVALISASLGSCWRILAARREKKDEICCKTLRLWKGKHHLARVHVSFHVQLCHHLTFCQWLNQWQISRQGRLSVFRWNDRPFWCTWETSLQPDPDSRCLNQRQSSYSVERKNSGMVMPYKPLLTWINKSRE